MDEEEQFKNRFTKIFEDLKEKQLSTIQAVHQILQEKRPIELIKKQLKSIGQTEQTVEQTRWKQVQFKQKFYQISFHLWKHLKNVYKQVLQQKQQQQQNVNNQTLLVQKHEGEQQIVIRVNLIKDKQEVSQTQQNKSKQPQQITQHDHNVQEQNIRNPQVEGNIDLNQLQKTQIINKQQNVILANQQQHQSTKINNQQIISVVIDQENENKQNLHQNHKQQNDDQDFWMDNQSTKKISSKSNTNEKNQTQKNILLDIPQRSQQSIEKPQIQQPNLTNKIQNIEQQKKDKSSTKKEKKQIQNKQYSMSQQQKMNIVNDIFKKLFSQQPKNQQKQQKHQLKKQTQLDQSKSQDNSSKSYKRKLTLEQLQRRQKQHQEKLRKNSQQGSKVQVSNNLVTKKLQVQKSPVSLQTGKVQQQDQVIKKYFQYNPHEQLKKRQIKNKREPLPVAHNQLQELINKLKLKLFQIFMLYLKQLKIDNFTFDAYPQSLDIKTFLSYYKKFKLAELYKPTDIPQLFKKFAQNGAWLNQQGFVALHIKIIGLNQNYIQHINQILEEKEKINKLFNQLKSQLLQGASKEQQKQHKFKYQELNKKNNESIKKYEQIYGKLKKINELIYSQQLKKSLNKGTSVKRSESDFDNYDKQRLKKIVDAHRGTSKQDIIQNLHQRIKKQQRKEQNRMNEIIQKYKFKNVDDGLTKVSKNLRRNSQSNPQIRKIQGYYSKSLAKLSQSDVCYHNQQIKSVKMQKNVQKSIFSQDVNIQNNKKVKPNSQKKIEIYRQLSLPKLPKRKLRDQSIYQSLNIIDVKAEMQEIKKLICQKNNTNVREDEQIMKDYFNKQKQNMTKQKNKRSPVQNTMKFI